MNPQPTCFTCAYWHPFDRLDGWCTQLDTFKADTETCFKHVLVKIDPIDKLKKQTQPVDREEWFC